MKIVRFDSVHDSFAIYWRERVPHTNEPCFKARTFFFCRVPRRERKKAFFLRFNDLLMVEFVLCAMSTTSSATEVVVAAASAATATLVTIQLTFRVIERVRDEWCGDAGDRAAYSRLSLASQNLCICVSIQCYLCNFGLESACK